MVEQKHEAKTSSTQRAEYTFPCSIEPVSLVPETTELKVVDNLGPAYAEGVPGYFISGSLNDTKESWWSGPPHIRFANLRVEDPKDAEAFTKRYGVLSRLYEGTDDTDVRKFKIDSATFMALQERLRQAWPGEGRSDVEAWAEIEGVVEEGFDTDVVVSGGFVHLRPKDLWASICFLYLRDAQAGKLGFCGNPDCPAPYFRKKRKTQKFCEAGPCADFARRKYALRYWNTEGKKKRDKQAKLQHEKRNK